jgi:hypothetical protein
MKHRYSLTTTAIILIFHSWLYLGVSLQPSWQNSLYLSGESDVQVVQATQLPNSNGVQKNKKDFLLPSIIPMPHNATFLESKISSYSDVPITIRHFLTPYFYQGSYLSFHLI